MMKNVLLIVVSILFITAASARENRIKVACIGNSITSVSYTHLDVYKRQVLCCCNNTITISVYILNVSR